MIEVFKTHRDFEPEIFKQVGVIIPRQIEYTLPLNHKFILHFSPDLTLVEKIFEVLTWSIYIKWQFQKKQN